MYVIYYISMYCKMYEKNNFVFVHIEYNIPKISYKNG